MAGIATTGEVRGKGTKPHGIQAEFGGPATNVKLSAYYRGGALVPASAKATIQTKGEQRYSYYRGATSIQPEMFDVDTQIFRGIPHGSLVSTNARTKKTIPKGSSILIFVGIRCSTAGKPSAFTGTLSGVQVGNQTFNVICTSNHDRIWGNEHPTVQRYQGNRLWGHVGASAGRASDMSGDVYATVAMRLGVAWARVAADIPAGSVIKIGLAFAGVSFTGNTMDCMFTMMQVGGVSPTLDAKAGYLLHHGTWRPSNGNLVWERSPVQMIVPPNASNQSDIAIIAGHTDTSPVTRGLVGYSQKASALMGNLNIFPLPTGVTMSNWLGDPPMHMFNKTPFRMAVIGQHSANMTLNYFAQPSHNTGFGLFYGYIRFG